LSPKERRWQRKRRRMWRKQTSFRCSPAEDTRAPTLITKGRSHRCVADLTCLTVSFFQSLSFSLARPQLDVSRRTSRAPRRSACSSLRARARQSHRRHHQRR
jgi:hypothetical protein